MDVGICFVNVVETAREFIAELVTEIAARLELIDPMILSEHTVPKTVALGSRPGKTADGRWFEHRKPIVARINRSRFLRSLGRRRPQRNGVCGRFHCGRCRIYQAKSSYPNFVGGIG